MSDREQVPISGTITVGSSNRWASFTDDELIALAYPGDVLPAWDHLIEEVDAEIKRRRERA